MSRHADKQSTARRPVSAACNTQPASRAHPGPAEFFADIWQQPTSTRKGTTELAYDSETRKLLARARPCRVAFIPGSLQMHVNPY